MNTQRDINTHELCTKAFERYEKHLDMQRLLMDLANIWELVKRDLRVVENNDSKTG